MVTLKMIFTLENDKSLTLSLREPKDGLTKAAVEAVMEDIITKKAVVSKEGSFAKAIKDSYISESDKQQLA